MWQPSARGNLQGEPVKIAANLPYYLTTPFMFKVLQSSLPVTSMTLLVQREAAWRMTARPGSKDYGTLTLLTQYYCRAQLVFPCPSHGVFPPAGS
jgi:16S rRNA (adenine1518-N6/adenine1519-N6)-dimethyltransferase